MKTYVDTSVLLRIVLQEPDPLPEWPQIQIGLTSALLRVECCRALDRLLRDGKIADEQYDARLTEIDEMLAQMLVLPITPSVLRIASQRFGVRVDTLDAVHLATAQEYRASHLTEDAPIFATHDATLATAARHIGFDVIGSN